VTLSLISCQKNKDQIPYGNKVELNNLIGEKEWKASKIILVNDSLKIRVQQDTDHIYFAIDFHEVNLEQFRWTELFIYDGNNHYRFHASGQLGEQKLRPPYWGENWNWGNNKMWTASTQRLAGEDRKSSTNQAYEFKFEKNKFKSKQLWIFIHTYTISTKAKFSANPEEYFYPVNGDKYKAATWHELLL